jgi:hypothetical protein
MKMFLGICTEYKHVSLAIKSIRNRKLRTQRAERREQNAESRTQSEERRVKNVE